MESKSYDIIQKTCTSCGHTPMDIAQRNEDQEMIAVLQSAQK